MPVQLLDIAVSVVGAGQAIGALQGLSQSALQAYSSNEMLVKSLDSLVAKQIAVSNHISLGEAKQESLALTKELVAWTQRLGVQSPFSQEGIAQAFQMAMAFGMTIDQAKAATEAVVDFASANAKGPADMQGIILAMGQMFSKGKAQNEELLQLAERTLPAYEYLGRAIGGTTAEIQDMASKGLIPSKQAFDAFITGINQDFGGSAREASNTIQGLISSFGDLVTIAERKIAAPTIETLRPIAIDINAALSSDEINNWIDRMGLQLAESIDTAIKVIPQAIETIKPIAETMMWAMGANIAISLGRGIHNQLLNLPIMLGRSLLSVGMSVVNQVPGVLMGRLTSALGIPSKGQLIWGTLWNAPSIYRDASNTLSGVQTIVQGWANRTFGAGSPNAIMISGMFATLKNEAGSIAKEAAYASLRQNILTPAAIIAVPIAIGGTKAAWDNFYAEIDHVATKVLENKKWWRDSTAEVSNNQSNITGLALRERETRAQIYDLEQKKVALQQKMAVLTGEERANAEESIADIDAQIAKKREVDQRYAELVDTQTKYTEVLVRLQDEEKKLKRVQVDNASTTGLGQLFSFQWDTLFMSESEISQKLTLYQTGIKNLTTALQQIDAAIKNIGNEDISLPNTTGEETTFTAAQKKIQDLAQQQASKLLGIRESTNQKLTEQWESYYASEAEAAYQRDLSATESEYQHQKAIEEAEYQFQRKQNEAQRTWNYEQSENARKHTMDMAEAYRQRLLELGKIADGLKPQTQTALDALATTEADFETATQKRLEDFNKKRQLLAQQGAMCKLPEEQKAFAEQEAQAAEAYQKQEQQQRAALGRQLIDYTVAMALKNNVSAQAMAQMVTGIAQSTGAYDSVTANLLGNTYAGIANWAQSGGQGAASVLNTIQKLPDAARDAKTAEENLNRTLREQAVAMFQRTGNVQAYQHALNAIPTQVATQLGLPTNEALIGSSVYQGQLDWLHQQSEAERNYAMQVEEDNRTHQHTVAEDLRTHQLDIEEIERQHRLALDEEERKYRLDREEAWRKHDQTLEDMRGKDHQKQLEAAMREGDRLMAEALAQAGNLSAAQRAALTGDYAAALNQELSMQNWLTQKLDAIDYSDPNAAQQSRESIYQSYAGLRQQYQEPGAFTRPRYYEPGQPAQAPRSYEGAPLNITVNLEADGLVLHTVGKTMRIVAGQWEEVIHTGRH